MAKNFGDNIRMLRKENGLTQEELANFLGVSFQTVSKWERNDTLPDILTLPSLSAFFGVTTDFLLGVDIEKQEEKIQSYLDEYVLLWEKGELSFLCEKLKVAVREFPGDYRLIVRYLNVLTAEAIHSKQPLRVRKEAENLYLLIQRHCTTDGIRIWSQKIMANYYKELSNLENSGIVIEDVKNILKKMPIMQNSQDYIATYLYEDTERKIACANAVCELMYLLSQVLINLCETDITMENKRFRIYACYS